MRLISYKKIILLVFILIFSFLLSLVIMKQVSIPIDANVLKNEWNLKDDENVFIKKLPNTFVLNLNRDKTNRPGLYKITTDFQIKKTLKRASLVLTQQPNNGFRIFIDGKYIVEVGDLEEGRANIWKDSGLFVIPGGIDSGKHTIEIELYAFDQLSLLSSPYIYDIKSNPIKYLLLKAFNRNIAYIMMGITFIMGILFLSLTIISQNENTTQVLLGISFLLWTVCMLDLIPINYLMMTYLTFKKIVTISFLIGSVLNFIVIYKILNNSIKYKLYFIGLIILILFLLIFPQTFYVFRISSRFAFVLSFLMCIPVFIHPKVLFSNDPSINFITVGVVGALYFAFRYLIYDFAQIPYLVLRHVGLYCYLSFIIVYFFIDYYKRNKRIIEESLRADHFYNKSVIDPLTNINNRNILNYINFTEISYALFICDLDDFKIINDTYGHDTGDDVLIKISSIIKDSIRDSDYAIRIGGDEFVFLLQNCPPQKAQNIAQNIWTKIDHSTVKDGSENILFRCSGGGIISGIGEDYKSALKRADKNLYEVKKLTKGTFNFSL